MSQGKTLAVIAALTLAVFVTACQKKKEETPVPKTQDGAGIAWMGYTEGMRKAKAAGKPVMVDFYTTWCKYCTLLDDTTYKDPGVIEVISRDFVAIKVNAEGTDTVEDKGSKMTEKELAASFKVSGYPTIWFFDNKGAPIAPLSGYNAPEDFKPVLTFITSGSYAKGINYGDYLKSLKK